jgi:hypothetical protein
LAARTSGWNYGVHGGHEKSKKTEATAAAGADFTARIDAASAARLLNSVSSAGSVVHDPGYHA